MMQPTNVLNVMGQLPKNIRQVGEPTGSYRIYMEDYVHTFVKKVQDLARNKYRVGILLGKSAIIESQQCIFIDGAILIEDIQGEHGELQFTASVWKKIYEDIRTYFPQLTMQGWFVTCKEEVQVDMIALEQVHRSAFSKEESVLYICYGDEVGIWKNIDSSLGKIQGFYIYYEKNKDMQEYMLEMGQFAPSERITKDETVENFRAIMERKKKKYNIWQPVLRGTGIFVTATILFFVANAWREHEILVSNEDETTTTEFVVQVGAEPTIEQTEMETTEVETTEPIIIETELSTEVDVQAGIVSNYYEVQKGDTLVGISMSFYGTLSMVEEICRLNEIENPNAIYTGQKIRLP